MKDEIKHGLLNVTPDLQQSKSRVRKAVLHSPARKKQLLPRFIFGCLVLLSIVLVATEWQTNNRVQGFSEETLRMYGLLDNGDYTERYRTDLLIAKYGELKGVKISKQDVKERVAAYESELIHTFDKVLRKNNITRKAYKEQYLTLRAHVHLVWEALLPYYEQHYPQFHSAIHSKLLLLDAVEEVGEEDLSFAVATNFRAIVLYEGENARVLALVDEKKWLEEQLIIMPIRDAHTLKTGDEVLLEDSFMIGVVKEKKYQKFVVSQDVTVVTENKTKIMPAMQKKISTLFEQMTWQNIKQTEEPDVQLKTLSGNYSVWYGDDIVIGSNGKGFIVSKEMIQEWAEGLIY